MAGCCLGGPYIGKCFELYGEYSESEVSVFNTYLKEGDVAIDVGANIGDLTLPLARLVGESGRVFAYESRPEVFNILCTNLALNRIPNVKPINAFVADGPEVSTDGGTWGKYAYIGTTWEPTFVSLDKLDVDRLRFIKVDVDGNELAVLKSGIRLIETYRPILYFENDSREKSKPLLGFVLGLGYRVFFHPAPIFHPDNFFGNPINEWAPGNVCSLMMLALPSDMATPGGGFLEVVNDDDWWDF
jgi:FkbM family methyltransferase